MLERTTKEIITPIDGHKVVVYDYVTGREAEAFESLSLSESDKEKRLLDSVHKALEMLIVSVDGKKEKVVDSILDFKMNDYRFVRDEVMKVVFGEETDKKKVAG